MANDTKLTAVPGIGAATAARLTEHGITTAEQLAATPMENLVHVPGFSLRGTRSANLHAAAVELVGGQPEKSTAKKKKKKGDKKNKKKGGKKKDKKGGKKGKKGKKKK